MFHVKNSAGDEETWTIDLKQQGKVAKGAAEKSDIQITVADDVFVDLVAGKITGKY